MIFSPVTAGIYSLNILGRMVVAWISIASRTIELLSRIALANEQSKISPGNMERRHTFAGPNLGNLASDKAAESVHDIPPRPRVRRGSDPGPIRSISQEAPTVPSEPPQDQVQSQIDELQKSPIHSSINIVSTALKNKYSQQNMTDIKIKNEMPHGLHTRAIIAGAVGIHVPKRYQRLLKARGWERLQLNRFREVTSEHSRHPSSDPVFQEFLQYTLPPNALILDNSFRVYPESKFREAAAGLLQAGFGIYQLVSTDARISVQKNGLASPYLLVLPYLGMAIVNTAINILDPPYSAVTVLDISETARQASTFETNATTFSLSPTTSIDLNASKHESPLVSRRHFREQSYTSTRSRTSNLRFESSVLWEHKPLNSGSVTGFKTPYATLAYSEQEGTWPELMEWLDIAYEKRIDICPVDRFYQTPWLSHAIIIGQFVWNTFNALLVPLVMLVVAGAWTRFQTSTYGFSLGFNLLALFGLPFIQFVLSTSHSFSRLRRDLKDRKEHGTHYWQPKSRDTDPEKGAHKVWRSWMTKRDKKRSDWWDLIAQSVGLYFPVRRIIIFAYVLFIAGVAMCEFVFVGINLRKTLECDMSLLI